jgi:hypothetical protein
VLDRVEPSRHQEPSWTSEPSAQFGGRQAWSAARHHRSHAGDAFNLLQKALAVK